METHTQTKSTSVHHKLLYQKLEQAISAPSVNRKTAASEALHEIAESIHKRSLVIIFSDMMEDDSRNQQDIFSALQHLKYNKHEVILFHVVDKNREIDFNFDNRPHLFVDVETGEQVKVHSNEVKEHYVQAMASYKKELMLKCAQYKIDFIEADIREGYKQVLMPYLIKRGKMN